MGRDLEKCPEEHHRVEQQVRNAHGRRQPDYLLEALEKYSGQQDQ
jgi:hypothetical protein